MCCAVLGWFVLVCAGFGVCRVVLFCVVLCFILKFVFAVYDAAQYRYVLLL